MTGLRNDRARLCSACILIFIIAVPHLASVRCAESRAKSRLARILVGRNEVTRQRRITALSRDVAGRIEVKDDLIYGLKYHAEQATDGKRIPPCFADLVEVVVQINRPESREAVIDLLDCPHVSVAMIAADCLGRHKVYEATDALKKQVERPEYEAMYGFRFNLIRSLVHMEHPDSIEFLGELSKTLDGQLRYELNEQLKNIDVDDFRGDDERYAAFKGERKPILVKPVTYSDSLDRIKLGRNQYYGIDIHAKRLLFVLDQSGSMNERVGSGTRLLHAKLELIQAIDGLPDDAEFGILFFDEVVRAWRDDLVDANEKNKKEAIVFVQKIQAGKKTNTYAALRRAMQFNDQLETVFLLTDGKPTTGQIIAPPAIVEDILRRNRVRHLTINTIGISVEGPTESFLKSLSKRSNGEFRLPR